MDIPGLNEFLKPHELRIANGYGDLKNKTYRIAHMGEIQMSDVERLLGLMDQYLKTL
jgi:aspartate aminotransferase-like enzyme